MAATKGEIVDHCNHDTLNNRRENLRLCTVAQNTANQRKSIRNTSGFKGVSWDRQNRQWEAKVCINGHRIFLGRFADLIEAARAYDAGAIKYFGEFAYTNFPMKKVA